MFDIAVTKHMITVIVVFHAPMAARLNFPLPVKPRSLQKSSYVHSHTQLHDHITTHCEPVAHTLTMAPPTKKRRITVTAPEKIEFDPSAREEYLTGFHKRKVARQKHAREEIAKRDKEEKLESRREVRHT
jgi:hypothetical protein